MTIKPMLEHAKAREEVGRLMSEALRVGQAMGVVGTVDVEARIAYAARLDNVRTSMLQDFEHRRPLEIDPILGAVCELGDRYGVATPEVRNAYAALQRLSTARI
jgi:2-dehydropantoate 2-reductase